MVEIYDQYAAYEVIIYVAIDKFIVRLNFKHADRRFDLFQIYVMDIAQIRIKYLFRKSSYEWNPADKRQMLHIDNGLMVRRIRDIIRNLIRVLTQVNLSWSFSCSILSMYSF